jgi:hypothetical protein
MWVHSQMPCLNGPWVFISFFTNHIRQVGSQASQLTIKLVGGAVANILRNCLWARSLCGVSTGVGIDGAQSFTHFIKIKIN